MADFEIREDEHGFGKVLIVKGSWSSDIPNYMLKEGIYALRLTDSYGFKGEDLSFIPSLTFLRSLEIYCWDAKEVKLIEALPQLEALSLQFKSVRKIDLSSFNNLRFVFLTWTKGMGSILKLNNIEHLNIQNYPYRTLQSIEHMTNLKRLYLTSRKLETLEGVEKLKRLEVIDLYNCQKLISKKGIEKCSSLKTIEIEACNKLSA